MGPISHHMLQHIVLMNIVAPLLVALLFRFKPHPLSATLPYATGATIALLWVWHFPPLFPLAMASPAVMALMHISLVAAAVWFWFALFSLPREAAFKGLFALLVAGKLFCLLGILFVFAPRPLMGMADGHHHHGGVMPANIDMLADQHVAGLLMLVACPLTYVLAGLVLAARWTGLRLSQLPN